jgi:hypothetical protein
VRSRTAASSAPRSAASSSTRPTSGASSLLEPECLHRLAQPAQVDVAERLEAARACGQAPRELVDRDLARCDLLLQT